MITWSEIKLFDGKKPSNKQFIREEKIQEEYDSIRSNYENKMIDYDEIVRQEIFGESSTSFVFQPCKYPYKLEDSIEHYILWLNPIYEWENDADEFVSAILGEIMEGVSYGWFENEKEDRSVISIRHFHVFFKREVMRSL